MAYCCLMDNSHHVASPYTRLDGLLMLALAALAVALRLLPGLRIIDDAYITYRYARNIVDGIGFVYSAGEHVLGTTTPLYTLLLAALSTLTRADLPHISVAVNAVAGGANAALLYAIARRLLSDRWPGVALGVLWAVAPKPVTFAVGGMETSVFVALTLGAFAAWLAGRTLPAAALTALAILTRPDALIWAGPLAVAMIMAAWRDYSFRPPLKRLPWPELAVALALIAPWVVFATATFGSPLTHSVAAKSVAYDLPPTQALAALIQHFATPFFEFDTFGSVGAIIGALIYPLLALMGSLFLYHANARSLPLTLYPWLFFAAFAIANPLMFRWYAAPTLPFYFLSIVAGLWGLTQRAGGTKVARAALAVAAIFWTAISLNAWTLHPDHGPDRPAPQMAWIRLELLYEQAGRLLTPRVTPHTVVAAGDIGAVGWYSGARILDTLGLVSPESTAYYPIDPTLLAGMPYAIAPDLIMDRLPDYVVAPEVYLRNGLLKDPRFAVHYRLLDKLPTDIYGSDGLLIYARSDPPLTP